ncbi:MAG: T9SS type A sorting domain-containing protein [Flavobacteriales bacterium]
MRGFGLLVSFFLATAAIAQNWALLNPAYRNNYSNDGTDTIRHQIRVMDVDTLGVDSFRFELNKVAVVCDECPAIGNTCAGCFVRVNQPQFLGFECVRLGADWHFFGTDTFMIRGDATLGTTWVFDETNGIMATVDDEWEEYLFGSLDTLRRIVLSSQDTIVLSRSFGIRRFARGTDAVDLIGVEGAGVGRVYPDPLAYFDYQVGDELTYRKSSVYQVEPFPPVFASYYHYWKVRITDRYDLPGVVSYSTSVASTYTVPDNDPGNVCDWPMPLDAWVFDAAGVLASHELIDAYPGHVLDESICYSSSDGSSERYIAEHGLTPDGRSIMRARTLGIAQGGPSAGFRISQPVAPDLYPISPVRINANFEEGVGLRLSESVVLGAIIRLQVELVGAILNADTVISPPSITWHVGTIEHARTDFQIFPNPATDRIVLQQAPIGAGARIHDLEGRLSLTQRITSPNETIDVQQLAPGIYLFSIDGMLPQRLVIAR